MPAGENRKEYRFPITVRELAGKGARIAVSSSTDEKVRVRISIEPNYADLHLIVDGQRHDRGSGEQRNRYQQQLEGGASETYELIVASVAPTASASRERSPKLIVELSVEEEVDCCSCQTNNPVAFSISEGLPCDFMHPEGWQGMFDRHQVSAVLGPSCD